MGPFGSTAVWAMRAEPRAAGVLRRCAADFARHSGAADETVHAVMLGVSEMVTNAIVHGYAGREPGRVLLRCRAAGEQVEVLVADEGAGIAPRRDSPGLGHGLATVGALAQTLEVTLGPAGRGTRVTMSFAARGTPPAAPGLVPLCALAVETIADVSCVDVARDGVLRRAAAEVRGDEVLTRWLRAATPPARPGTATWAALREGGARLVVHDPTAPRSPGGTGDRLGLLWWVAVALEDADGRPAALWGLGGRDGGRPVPSEHVLAALHAAAAEDLSQVAARAALRGELALIGSGR